MTQIDDDVKRDIIGASPKLSEEDQRISLSLYRLLSEGKPVPLSRLSTSTGVPIASLRETLALWSGLEWDHERRIVGFWGLTLSRTGHRFHVGSQDLFTWC